MNVWCFQACRTMLLGCFGLRCSESQLFCWWWVIVVHVHLTDCQLCERQTWSVYRRDIWNEQLRRSNRPCFQCIRPMLLLRFSHAAGGNVWFLTRKRRIGGDVEQCWVCSPDCNILHDCWWCSSCETWTLQLLIDGGQSHAVERTVRRMCLGIGPQMILVLQC